MSCTCVEDATALASSPKPRVEKEGATRSSQADALYLDNEATCLGLFHLRVYLDLLLRFSALALEVLPPLLLGSLTRNICISTHLSVSHGPAITPVTDKEF